MGLSEYKAIYGLEEKDVDKLEQQLRLDVTDALKKEPDHFRQFDAIFVDEVQDFDPLFMTVLEGLARQQHYFLVGDIGQKIFDREHDVTTLGIVVERAELEKS